VSLEDRLRDTVAVSVCPRRSVRSAFLNRNGLGAELGDSWLAGSATDPPRGSS
jgi:hypothetical protein